jgi:hypothetical protein
VPFGEWQAVDSLLRFAKDQFLACRATTARLPVIQDI